MNRTHTIIELMRDASQYMLDDLNFALTHDDFISDDRTDYLDAATMVIYHCNNALNDDDREGACTTLYDAMIAHTGDLHLCDMAIDFRISSRDLASAHDWDNCPTRQGN